MSPQPCLWGDDLGTLGKGRCAMKFYILIRITLFLKRHNLRNVSVGGFPNLSPHRNLFLNLFKSNQILIWPSFRFRRSKFYLSRFRDWFLCLGDSVKNL